MTGQNEVPYTLGSGEVAVGLSYLSLGVERRAVDCRFWTAHSAVHCPAKAFNLMVVAVTKASWTDLDPSRQKLMSSKLGTLLSWEKPVIRKSVGPFDPSIFDKFEDAKSEIVSACLGFLQRQADEDVEKLAFGRCENAALVAEWKSLRTSELREMPIPPWYAGGFGHPDHIPDFKYWASHQQLSIHKVLCLSVGVEPESFTSDQVSNLGRNELAKLWPTMEFLRLRDLLLRKRFGPSANSKLALDIFIFWAERVDLEVHPEFVAAVKRVHLAPSAVSAAAAADTNRKDRREIETIAKLFTAIAIQELGYQPDAKKGPIPKEIADMVAKLGMQVTDDTVRKYLKIGASFLPKGWKP